eukprot:10997050-Alexandrium_andersonii.AAC.1
MLRPKPKTHGMQRTRALNLHPALHACPTVRLTRPPRRVQDAPAEAPTNDSNDRARKPLRSKMRANGDRL